MVRNKDGKFRKRTLIERLIDGPVTEPVTAACLAITAYAVILAALVAVWTF